MAGGDVMAGLERKLGSLAKLGAADIQAIRELPHILGHIRRGHHLVREGSKPENCCLLVKGFAYRSKVTVGKRQIVSFHVPGDMLDLQHLQLPLADHDVQAMTPALVAWITKEDLQTLMRKRPTIMQALWRDNLVDASIAREWVLNVGRRKAKSRVAHILSEFVTRCVASGFGDPEGMEIPQSQDLIADATGLTPVHVNRMMRQLAGEGIIERSGRSYRVQDQTALQQIAGFNPAYLHGLAA